MKNFLTNAVTIIEDKMMPPGITEHHKKLLSKRAIRIMIWSRIIMKLWMWILALYLIANFASLMRHLLIRN